MSPERAGSAKAVRREKGWLCLRNWEKPVWLEQPKDRERKRGWRDRQGLDPSGSFLGLKNHSKDFGRHSKWGRVPLQVVNKGKGTILN